PVSNSWSSAGNMTTARGGAWARLLQSGKVVVAGGISATDSEGSVLYSAELYDPVSNSWSSAGSLNTEMPIWKAILLKNGKVFVIGYYYGSSRAELYDPDSNAWSSAGSIAFAPWSTILLQNGKVLVIGFYYDDSQRIDAELYDPDSNTWSSAGSLSARYSPGKTILLPNNKVLNVGGALNVEGTNWASAEIYIPQTSDLCFFSWAEANYSDYLSPSGAVTSTLAPYPYRYYANTNTYLGISSSDNHLYYLDSNSIMTDLGASTIWMKMAGC
ncbi:MAG: hypothetical protein PHH11_18130, partial [Methylomonas sp.]|nr:hypothetical protein [Methylomonas sp.]